MEWKTDPNLLAKKILARIEKTDGEISYTDLEKIATDKDIDLFIFDAAISVLHRHKKVKQTARKNEVYYKAVPKKKKVAYQPPKPIWTPEMIAEAERLCGDGVPIPFYNPVTDGPYPTYGPDHSRWLKEKMKKEKEERQNKYWAIRNANKKVKA